jgi:hypothetical protein
VRKECCDVDSTALPTGTRGVFIRPGRAAWIAYNDCLQQAGWDGSNATMDDSGRDRRILPDG